MSLQNLPWVNSQNTSDQCPFSHQLRAGSVVDISEKVVDKPQYIAIPPGGNP
jgi:hypothetical protein